MFARRSLALAVAALIVAGMAAEQWLRPPATRISFISVGQGDCTVFQHQGRTVLIDAGGGRESNLLKELRQLKVRRIDLLLITHPDIDHMEQIPAILRRCEIARFGIPEHFREHRELQSRLREWRISPRQIVWIKRGSHAAFEGAKLEFDFAPWQVGDEDNNGSLWVRISVGRGSVLLSGDAEEAAESEVLSRRGWSAEIFKAGHHGSANSTTAETLRLTSPEAVIVSCGAANSYGHPAPQTTLRIHQANAEMYRTDRQGDLVFELTEQGFHRD